MNVDTGAGFVTVDNYEAVADLATRGPSLTRTAPPVACRRRPPIAGNAMSEHLIELRNITKSYGSIYALGGVSLHVDRGEVVGLIGDNGAGKSTLIKILAGVIKPTCGDILVGGKQVNNWNAAKSRDAGIETVFQDRALAVQQTIVRNIFMGREIADRFGFLNTRKEHRGSRAADARDRLHLQGLFAAFDRRPAFRRRTAGRRHRPRHLQQGRPDRPRRADDGAVADRNREGLPFRPPVRACGRSIIFIGHNIHHVYDIADRFVVLDRGTVARRSDQDRDWHRREAHRLHGACGPSQRHTEPIDLAS